MTDFSLIFDGVSCGYGDTEILRNISGQIDQGQTLGIFGRNGVGKTTFARALAGELPLFSGQVKINGRTIDKVKTHARRRLGIGYMPQTGMVFDNLTVRENLSLSDGSNQEMEKYFAIFPRLGERLNQKAGAMSGGERKILSFTRAMLENTKVIILDEPSEGVQPENIENMQNCILEKQNSGVSFVLIEQNLNMLMALANQYIGLDSGHVVYEATSEECSREDILSILTV